MTLKEGDFIEIEYLAKLEDTNTVFDLTNEEDAKKYNLYDSKQTYKPIVICVGKNDILKGLDSALKGKEPGKSYTLTLSPEDAFGKKRTDLIKLVPTSMFRKQNINAVPGLQVNLDGIIGTIKTVTGGRTLVDFNHPLSGKKVIYELKIIKVITTPKEKVEGMLKNLITDFDVEEKEGKITIHSKIKDEKFKAELEKELKTRIPEIKSITFDKR